MTTLPQLLIARAKETPGAVAVREKDRGIWHELTWADYVARVRAFALGLTEYGIQRGSHVAIVGDAGAWWYIAELAVQSLGGVCVGLDADTPTCELAEVLAQTEARCVVAADQEQVDKVLDIAASLPRLEHVVYRAARGLRTYTQPFLLSFDDLTARGAQGDQALFDKVAQLGTADDPAFVCTTSTLSHADLLNRMDNLLAIDPIQAGDNYLSLIPCGSVVEQVLGLTASLRSRQVVNVPEEPETAPDDLREIGPRTLLASQRFWDALAAQVDASGHGAGWPGRQAFEWSMRLASQTERSTWTTAQRALADWLVWAPLRDRLGVRNVRRAYSAGAPVRFETLRFFRALGINLTQVPNIDVRMTAHVQQHSIGASHGLLSAA